MVINLNLDKIVFLAENCVVIDVVSMANDCSTWYNAVVRGDVHKIADTYVKYAAWYE